ncbi:DUF3037 domain-containing protein [Streptosporangium jomthongense]|uniref:DUF3037 domain-containing protein n=1 Tax=Streptosporangium jomthongense TaxID=1193683 RepID=A0ABV8F4R4_9ACTN
MSRYVYSIVRCLPDPRTGEFVNVGAVAGDPVTGDWTIRQISNLDRARKFAGTAALETAISQLIHLDEEIDRSRTALLEDHGEPLGEEWLLKLHRDHRNVVQFSEPAPLLAHSAEEALAFVFEHLIIDPVSASKHPSVTKRDLHRDLREAFRAALISEEYIRAKVQIHVGARVHTPVDFAIANGRVVQLTQTWSFRLAQVEDVPLQVKAWGYALERLRRGEDARVIDSLGRTSTISPDVDLQVVIAPPETRKQTEAFEESQQVFDTLYAHVHSLDEVQAVTSRAAELAQALH